MIDSLRKTISFSNSKSADDLYILLSNQGIDMRQIIRYDRMLVFYDDDAFMIAIMVK